MKITVEVSASGPLADGTAAVALGKWRRAVVRELAKRGLQTLKAWPMDESGRATGGFRRELKAKQSGFTAVINGPMVKGTVWAPWLEGVSTRNESTGFGGYHLFEITAERLNDIAPEVGEELLQQYLPEMGGG